MKSESQKVHFKSVISNPNELNKVGEQMKKLEKDLGNDNKNYQHYYHVVGTYSFSTIIPLVLVAYVLYKFIEHHRKRTTAPVIENSGIEIKSISSKAAERKTSPKIRVVFEHKKPSTSTMLGFKS